MSSLITKESKQEKYGVTWQLDAEVTQCNECSKPFNAFRRKHHCRNCGMIFCHECSKTKMNVRGSSNLKRVCDPCKTILTPLAKKSALNESGLSNSSSKSLSTQVQQQQDPLKSVVLRWADQLMDGTSVTCHFQGILVLSGTAVWYRSNGTEESRVEVDRCRLTSTRDSNYNVRESDVGYYITCVIELTGNNGNDVEATSDCVVKKTSPGLQGVNIGLRPHQHTLRCDRSERVCDAVGKFREGETLFMTLVTRGMEGLQPSEVKCSYRWLKSKQPIELHDHRIIKAVSSNTAEASSSKDVKLTQRRGKGSKMYTQAVVLFDFDAMETNEMTVHKGDIIKDVEVVDADWSRGSLNGIRGAVPTSYIEFKDDQRQRKEISETEKATEAADKEEETDSSDEEGAVRGTRALSKDITRRWRGSIFKMCTWEEISSGNSYCDKEAELNISLDYVGHMIALEVTLEDIPANGQITQLKKQSLPVGPIEPANCRIDNLVIVPIGDVQIGSTIQAKYDYYGGREGASTFSWIRITPQGSRDNITNMMPRNPDDLKKGIPGPETYVLTEEDMGCRLKVHVRVVRDDGLTVSYIYFLGPLVLLRFLLLKNYPSHTNNYRVKNLLLKHLRLKRDQLLLLLRRWNQN
jgi:hypothetical protein